MATTYLREALRNNAAVPGAFPGLRILAGSFVNSDSSTHVVTIETKCAYILFAHVSQLDAGTLIATAEAASTLYPGTRKITYTTPGSATNGGKSQYLIIGSGEKDNTATGAGDSTVVASE